MEAVGCVNCVYCVCCVGYVCCVDGLCGVFFSVAYVMWFVTIVRCVLLIV